MPDSVASALSPADVVIRIVLQLPFLSGYAALDAQSDSRSPSRPLSFDLASGTQEDLVLQRYSDDLRADLAQSFPHRVRSYAGAPDALVSRAQPVCAGSSVLWAQRTLDVDMWSVGVGLVTATYRLDAPTTLTWEQLGADVEEGRHILKDRLGPLQSAAVADVRRAISAGELDAGQFLDSKYRHPEAEALWTHVTFLLEAKANTDLESLDELAKALTRGGAAGPTSFELKPVVLRISLDSAVGYRPGGEEVAASIVRVIGVHTVIWAALTDLDRRLLRLRPTTVSPSLRGLEREMDRTMNTYEQARRLRVALESVSVHLSGLDRSLWDAVANVWGLATPLRTIDVKLESEQHVLSYAMASLASRRARVLGTLALVFSVASIVGVVGALVDLSSRRLQVPSGPNLWLVAGLIALVIAAGLLVWSVVLRSVEQVPRRQE